MTEKRSPLYKNKTRIFRPNETRQIIENIPKVEHKTMFKALLFSGMRHIEMQRFQKHPEWFNGTNIYLPVLAQKKKKRKQKDRTVHLSAAGKEVIYAFINLKKRLPNYSAWDENLKRWGKKAGVEVDVSQGIISAKSTRKTYESYLVSYFPHLTMQIAMSQGHTSITAMQHYLNTGFDERDKLEMKDFVEGWS